MATKAEIESWKTDPVAAYAQAKRVISSIAQNGGTEVDFLDEYPLPALSELPPELLELSDLEALDLTRTRISDIKLLANFSRLKFLGLNSTPVEYLEPLAQLRSLQSIGLDGTKITTIKELAALTNLRQLYLAKTHVNDLSPLANLVELEELYLESRDVQDITPLQSLQKLAKLHLDNAQIVDLAPLTTLSELATLRLNGCRVVNFAPLSSLTNLEVLSLDRTLITDLSPISSLTKLQTLSLNGAPVANLGPLRDLNSLAEAAKQNDRRGLHFGYTPAIKIDDALRDLSKLDNPERTIQTLQYLNGEHPEYGGPPATNPETPAPDLPSGPGIVLPAEFNGSSLVALKSPPPERAALETLFKVLKREAEDLRGDNSLGNVPQVIQKAVNNYAASLPKEYDDIDPVLIGTEGKQLATKYDADSETIKAETPAQAGQIEALLIAHADLIDRLPTWLSFIAETEGEPDLTDDQIDLVRDELQDIIDEWSAPPVPVDEIIPEKLSQYRQRLDAGRESALAALHALKDAVSPILRYAINYYKEVGDGALQDAKPGIRKVLSVTVVGGLLALSSKLPWWGAALEKGLEFLKLVGLL